MSSIIKLYRNGLTAGVCPSVHAGGAKRGKVGGWSPYSVRSNTRFLYSVHADRLTGVGYSFTFTIRHCPESSEDWHKARRRLVERFRYLRMVRLHWLTEWQRRMVPHLHGVVFFDPESEVCATRMLDGWLAVAAEWAPSGGAQTVAPLYDSLGWFKYLSKHAARGLRHYQRSPEMIPPGWSGRTGRMWGALGDWPRDDSVDLQLSMPAFHALRRLVRSRRKAAARAEGNPARISHARRMLKCNDRKSSSVRGLSDWIDLEDSLAVLEPLRRQGYSIVQ